MLKNALEEYENERLDEIIEKYKDTEPEYSEEHKRRMEKLFKKEKCAFSWKKALVRAAMIILAVFISGAVALQVEAVRIKLKNWCYEITGEAIHIGDSIEKLPGYSEIDMPIYVLSDKFVEKYGYKLRQKIGNKRIESEYKNIEGEYILVIQLKNAQKTQIDNEGGKIEKKNINGKDTIIIYRDKDLSIYFQQDNNQICVHTNMRKEKIEEIINNIVIKP
ncbi:MAG: DUF4367 domain-containing protein [Oscillospiraceae bacterium]|nr:DUF4367 domain-containing protein [Oscillospiraceae bacterium]